jgi:hypothetical protein
MVIKENPEKEESKESPIVTETEMKSNKLSENDSEIFTLSDSKIDESFYNNFVAVFKRRLSVYNADWGHAFTDIFAPALAMVIGVTITSITLFDTSPSRIMDPSKTSDQQQLIVIDSNIAQGYNFEIVEELAELMPKSDELLDIRFTNSTTIDAMPFDEFGKYIFNYGTENAPEMPHFYAGYQIYKADTRDH